MHTIRNGHCLALLILVVVGLAADLVAAPARRPNILLFLADDMTYTDLGCYGNADVRTPRLDAFAREGLRFRRCFTPAPMCSPLRQSLYTGLYPVRNGAHPNHSRVHDWVKSLPHHLKSRGYRTAILGKRHEAPEAAFPFESLGGRHHDGGKGVDLDLSRVDSFLGETAETGQPFCLVVASNQPHMPWNRGDASVYDPAALTVPPYLVDTRETRLGLSKYYAEITYLDAQFGYCLDALERSGLGGGTVVLFLSEQGSNFPFCKWTCYGTGIRSAALLRWPGVVARGESTDALVGYVDVVPTLVDIAGGESEELDLDGRSFAPLLREQILPETEFVFAVQTSLGIYHGPEAYGIRSVSDGRFLFIRNLNYEAKFRNSVVQGSAIYESWRHIAPDRHEAYQRRPAQELYDLEADPWNLRNLAAAPAHRVTVQRLSRGLDEWMRQQGDLGVETELKANGRRADQNP